MEKISKILGKPVISIFDGTVEGYVKNVFADKKLCKVLWLCVFDDESQEEKLVETKNVYSFCEDAVMIKNNAGTYLLGTVDLQEINPIGYKIYQLNGKQKNKIADFEIDERMNITNIFLQDGSTFDKAYILNIGKNTVIEKENKNVSLANFRPKQPNELAIETNQKVEILEEKTEIKIAPKKIVTTNYDFLIGRKVGQNIYTENGQLIAKKQSRITNQIIDLASQNGKLKELTTFSLV